VLCGAEVKERTDQEWPWGEATAEEFEQHIALLPDRWGAGLSIGYIAPGLAGDARAREWCGRVQTNAATPGAAESFMRMAFDIDVREVVPAIRVPTLVIHRADDKVCHVENARFLARHIPGAHYVELPGSDHAPWADGDDIIAEIREFVTGVREPANQTGYWPRCCSPTSSAPPSRPADWATDGGEIWCPSITR